MPKKINKVLKTVKKSAVKARPVVRTLKAKVERASVVANFSSREVKGEVSDTKPRESANLTVPVLDPTGKVSGKMTLPKELFGVSVNQQLLAQSVRVHLANMRRGRASTKTRGEVEGSTRKIYKQKGTGKARHGGIRAPIFVGGGVAFGPKPQDHSLLMPQKMQRVALSSALTSQLASGSILFVDGLGDLPPKTKDMAKAMLAVGVTGSTLLVTGSSAQKVNRAARNIAKLDVMEARSIFPYALLSHPRIVIMKDAVSVLTKTFITPPGKAKA